MSPKGENKTIKTHGYTNVISRRKLDKASAKFQYSLLQTICIILYIFFQLTKSKQINAFQCRLEDNTGIELRKITKNMDT